MNRAVIDVDRGAKRMLADVTRFSVGAVAAFGAVGIAVGVVATKAFMDFESAFAGVKKTVSGTPQEFDRLSKAIRGMAKEMPNTAVELSRIMELGGQLGVEGTENLQQFTKTIAMFGTATGMASEEAATAFARISNIMQEPIRNIDRMGSVVAKLGDAGAATEREILEMANRIAGAGKIAGLTSDEVFSIAAAFSSAGIEAEAGGTAIQKVLLDLNNSGRRGIGEFVRFMEDLKASGTDSARVLRDLGFEETRLQRAFLSVAGAGELLNKQLAIGKTEWTENKRLIEETAKRNETLAAQLQITKNRFNEIFITLGEQLAPHVKAFNGFLQELTFTTDGLDSTLGVFVNNTVPVVISGFMRMADAAQLFMKGIKLGQIGFLALMETAGKAMNPIISNLNEWIKKQDELNRKAGMKSTAEIFGFGAPGATVPSINTEHFKQAREDLQREFEILNAAPKWSKQIADIAQRAQNARETYTDAELELLKVQHTYTDAELAMMAGGAPGGGGGLVEELMNEKRLMDRFNQLPGMDAAGRAKSVRGPLSFGFGFGSQELAGMAQMTQEEIEAKDSLKLLEEIKNSKIQLTQEEHEKMLELQAAYTEKLKKLKQAEYEVLIVSGQQAFSDLADITAAFAGKQSGMYKAMFATSKAFAIAESIIKIQQGIAGAAAMPWPLNLAAIASVVAATANIVSSIQAVKLEFSGKRAAGGSVSANSAYLVGERGPEVFNPASNGSVLSNNMLGSGVTVIVNNQNGSNINVDDSRLNSEGIIEISVKRAKAEIQRDIAKGEGPVHKTFERAYGLRRGTR